MRYDQWANKRGWMKYVCYCDGYHHPHHKWSLWCNHNPRNPHTVQAMLETGDYGPEHFTEVAAHEYEELPF